MAAVLSPPHLHPGLVRLPGVVRLPGARSRVRPVPGPVRRPVALPAAPGAAPSAATYRRRRAMALLLLVAVALVVQVAVSLAAGAVLATEPTAAVGTEAVSAVAAAPAPAVSAVGTAATSPPSVYVVRPGDSLWSIAQQLQPDSDPRPLVDALAERAGSSALRPGQRIDLDGLAL